MKILRRLRSARATTDAASNSGETIRRINGREVGQRGGVTLRRDPTTGILGAFPRPGDARFAGVFTVRHV